MNRKPWIWASLAAVLLLVVAYSVYWWIVARQLDAGIDNWQAAQWQAGLTVDYDRTPVGGFPFAFRATFHHTHMAGAVDGQHVDWQGPDVEATISPFDLYGIGLSAPGHHALDFGQGPATLDATALRVALRINGAGLLSSAATDFTGATVALPDGRTFGATAGSASLIGAPQPPKSDRDPLLDFAFSGRDLRLPPGTVLLTGDPLTMLAFAGTVKGPMPLAPLRTALGAWRDQGGSVDLHGFALAQGPLSIDGRATIALEPDLQPIVAADLKVRGLAPAIDLLQSQGRIAPNDALKFKLFVKGAERDAPGGGKEVATGITLQGGYLSWGPFRLAKVPPIEWP